MARKTSGLAMLAAGAGGAAIAGYGFSIGRDLWKSTKKNSGIPSILFALAAAVALPMLGARGIVRGHDRSPVGTLLITLFGNLLLIACGFALSVLLLGLLTHNDTHAHARGPKRQGCLRHPNIQKTNRSMHMRAEFKAP